MKIEGPGGPARARAASRTRKADKASGDGFADYVRATDPALPAAPVAGVASVDAVLAVQEVDDVSTRRKRAIKRAENLLDHLDEVRHDLLIGAIPKRRLREIEEICAAARDRVDDPRLRALLDEVELRAAVELAKWGESAGEPTR